MTDFASYITNRLPLIEDLNLPDGRRFGDAMAPFQREAFEAIFAAGAARNVWIGRPRGGSKTHDCASIAICDLLLAPDHATLIACAADQDQARLLRDAFEQWVADSPALHGAFDIHRDTITNVVTKARLRIMASDAPSALGLGAYRLYADEVAAWPTDLLWGSLYSGMHKVKGSRTFVLTTAGSPASWAYKLWEQASESPSWQILHTTELAPWLDTEQLEDQRRMLPASLAARFLENRWVLGEDAMFTTEQVDACIDWKRKPMKKRDRSADWRSEYVLGVDYGATNDRTAIAVVKIGLDGQPHMLVDLWVRQGTKERPVRISEVKRQLELLTARFEANAIADPYELRGTIEDFDRTIEAYSYAGEGKAQLSNILLRVIREAGIRLLPDLELRQELLSLVMKERSRGWVMDHPPGGHDDRAMAIALALVYAEQRARRVENLDLYVGSF